MSRTTAGDTVYVKPTNNIYTVLSGIALLVVLLGLIIVWVRAGTLYGGLLSAPQSSRSSR